MSNVIKWFKPYLFWLMVISLGAFSGLALGASVATALKFIKNPPIQIISLNEEALFREQSLKLASLNLDEKALKKHLADFKKAFLNLLERLPKHFVVVPAHLLLRTDNVEDLTEVFRNLLIESQNAGVKQ